MRDGLAAAMESGRLNKRATASRDTMPAPTHSNHPNNYNNNNHIIHINAKTNNEPITTNLCPGAPPLDPAGGYAPRPPILALRARFLNKMKQIQLANKIHFFGTAPLRYGTIFKNFRLLRPHPHAWGTPKCRKTDPHPPP